MVCRDQLNARNQGAEGDAGGEAEDGGDKAQPPKKVKKAPRRRR